jgi:hypothetical protein
MTVNPNDYNDLQASLARAHKMSISSASVPETSTLYGSGAAAIRELSEALAQSRQELREFETARDRAENVSWGVLLDETSLYPDEYDLQGTETRAGLIGRQNGDKIYIRNFDGLALPIPGNIYKHLGSWTLYLVVHVENYENSAVVHVEPYTGEIPENKVR